MQKQRMEHYRGITRLGENLQQPVGFWFKYISLSGVVGFYELRQVLFFGRDSVFHDTSKKQSPKKV